jgi:nicotinamide mononucleotide transporter
MTVSDWLSNNWIEIFGAITGIIYVFLEIRQNIWLWPVGIITSAVYIIVFFTSKFYADMSLQGYYLAISCAGWYWWVRGDGRRAKDHRRKDMETGRVEEGEGEKSTKSPFEGGKGDVKLNVTRLTLKTGTVLAIIFVLLYFLLWFVLSRLTDSPVPEWDSFITSLSIIATWMLARKIYEHWFLWIVVNSASLILFVTRGLYPTVILYLVYLVMSFAGLKVWKRSL